MAWVDIVALLAVGQLILFAILVGKARVTYGVEAPATTGHPMFERYYRVQMNTVEALLAFLPALFLAAKYWSPVYAALPGVAYLVGRMLYLRGYVSDPKRRGPGFGISFLATGVLLVAALYGAVKALAGH
jgi:uncharacterized MAPEG superfamily protein